VLCCVVLLALETHPTGEPVSAVLSIASSAGTNRAIGDGTARGINRVLNTSPLGYHLFNGEPGVVINSSWFDLDPKIH
jgi:hypothetical protein